MLNKESVKKVSINNIWHDEDIMVIEQSPALSGSMELIGAKNAVLVSIASLILTDGISTLSHVPHSQDVRFMITLLRDLGAIVSLDEHLHELTVDTTALNTYKVSPEIMKKMRASVLVMGPLLARFGRAEIALPGGCSIGPRPINFHLKNFKKMGVDFEVEGDYLYAATRQLKPARIVLEYPSVGATENILMAATCTPGKTVIINAALEPEVLDLICLLKKMGAHITINAPASIEIEGVEFLQAVKHPVIHDRLEAGGALLAAAVTKGSIEIPNANAHVLDVFLDKLEEMGHSIQIGQAGLGIKLKATDHPKAVSFRTAPYPGFPTDLQAPMMAAQCLADGESAIHETVFENRFLHIAQLQKMGADIEQNGDRVRVRGVNKLVGCPVEASDIRASCALMIAGLVAQGQTIMTGVHHWKRGYDALDKKLTELGARLWLKEAAR